MKTNKFLSILLALALLISAITIPAIAEDNIKVLLNGEELEFDVQPQIIVGRTMVPMRVIFEALGADVYFIDENENQFFKRIVAVKNYIKIFIHIVEWLPSLGEEINREYCKDFDEYYLNSARYNPENYIKMDVLPLIVDGRTLVPLRAVSESLGVDVEWIDSSKTVLLTCDESFIADKNRDRTFFDEFLRSILRPNLNPKTIDENTTIPEFDDAMPVEIQELAKEIYNVQNGAEAILKIIERFGEPEDEGVQGFPVPVWNLDHGKITFMTFYGVIYENDEGSWFLTKREVRLGDVLNCEFNVHSLIENNSSIGIGDLLLRDDNTYLFAYAWQAEGRLTDSQKEAFFINNRTGTWEIKFEEGYSFDTDITGLDSDTNIKSYYTHTDMMGTKVAEIIFTGKNGESGVVSVIVPLFPANVSFETENLKCRMNPHVIKSPFTMGYI